MTAFCLGDGTHLQLKAYVMAALLIAVATGYRPRYLAVVHFYLAFSIAQGIRLPDGGESVAAVITLLVLPLCLMDGRRWGWQVVSRSVITDARGSSDVLISGWPGVRLWKSWIMLASTCAVRIQVSIIYLHSTVSKFGVPDWVNGSAEYYFVRGTMFGVSPQLQWIAYPVTRNPLIVSTLTWSALVVELLIAMLILCTFKWRRRALVLDMALHGFIIVAMGLWSFSFIMVGSMLIAASGKVSKLPSSARSRDKETDDLAAATTVRYANLVRSDSSTT